LASPRIAYFDIENAPSLGWFYDPHKEYNIVATEQDWFMLSFAWKWAGDSKAHVKALCDYPCYTKSKTDDTALVKDLWQLFDDADILIGHNVDRFDRRKANGRFLGCGLRPPSPYKTIDTLKIARREFMLNSNRLGDLGEFLGLGSKLATTGWDTWRRCIEGDARAWGSLKKYNRRDVILGEQVYEKLRAWNRNPPTRGCGCPSCGSSNVQSRGVAVAKTRRYQRLQCQGCGHWHQGELIK
jgi:hypothetical protein